MRIAKVIVLSLICVTLFVSSAFAQEPTPVFAMDDYLIIKADGNFLVSESYVLEDNVYLPLRAVFESIGAEVSWNNETRTVVVVLSNKKTDKYHGEYKTPEPQKSVQLPVYFDCIKVMVNGEPVESSAFIYEDKAYIAIDVFETFASNLFFDQQTGIVRIYSDNYNTKDAFCMFGDNSLTKEEFMEIAEILYGGNYEGIVADNFNALNTYLLSEAAVFDVADEVNIDMSEESLNKYYEENSIDKLMPDLGKENNDNIKENLLKMSYVYEQINTNINTLFTPSDEELKMLYENSPYSEALYLQAQHILIPKDENGEGLRKINELLKNAKKKGSDFTALMLANSQDPGSKVQPEGYIFTEGEMVESFYKAALETPVGEISDVVESEYGYHIIKKIAEWKNGIPMKEVEENLIASYSRNKLNEAFFTKLTDADVWFNKRDALNEIFKVITENTQQTELEKQ